MEWSNINDKLPDYSCVLKVKRKNGDECKAYFHKDKMAWLNFYYQGKLSHFQDHKTLEFLFDVTHFYN